MLIGPNSKPITESDDGTIIAIVSQATVYTKSFSLRKGEYFAVSYKAASSGNIKLQIELEQSYRKPTTEGSADATWAIGEGATAIETALADTTQHHKTMSPIPVAFGRLKITGLPDASGNAATTTLTAFLSKQEQV